MVLETELQTEATSMPDTFNPFTMHLYQTGELEKITQFALKNLNERKETALCILGVKNLSRPKNSENHILRFKKLSGPIAFPEWHPLPSFEFNQIAYATTLNSDGEPRWHSDEIQFDLETTDEKVGIRKIQELALDLKEICNLPYTPRILKYCQ
jgi:hypothetical protein